VLVNVLTLLGRPQSVGEKSTKSIIPACILAAHENHGHHRRIDHELERLGAARNLSCASCICKRRGRPPGVNVSLPTKKRTLIRRGSRKDG